MLAGPHLLLLLLLQGAVASRAGVGRPAMLLLLLLQVRSLPRPSPST
jgi:hypothetical protein